MKKIILVLILLLLSGVKVFALGTSQLTVEQINRIREPLLIWAVVSIFLLLILVIFYIVIYKIGYCYICHDGLDLRCVYDCVYSKASSCVKYGKKDIKKIKVMIILRNIKKFFIFICSLNSLVILLFLSITTLRQYWDGALLIVLISLFLWAVFRKDGSHRNQRYFKSIVVFDVMVIFVAIIVIIISLLLFF